MWSRDVDRKRPLPELPRSYRAAAGGVQSVSRVYPEVHNLGDAELI